MDQASEEGRDLRHVIPAYLPAPPTARAEDGPEQAFFDAFHTSSDGADGSHKQQQQQQLSSRQQHQRKQKAGSDEGGAAGRAGSWATW